jgi:anti-sigma regulatory factor (Ser/Thr protein kinase)
VLDREFDADALAGLRQAVLVYATACSMPEDRAADVMLAVHELAANAVRHGAGHGRLRIHVTAGTLWLVREMAGHLRVTSGPDRLLVTAVFTLSAGI